MRGDIYDHACTRCVLHSGAKTVCMEGVGNPANTSAMIVGEAPGRNEDERGVPFIGRAGQILDTELVEAFITPNARSEVFVTNVVKCRPPGNRQPKTAESRACSLYLAAEIEALDPFVILALGNPAAWELLHETGITRIRGTWHRLDRERETWVMPTFHPAFVDRQGRASLAAQQFRDDIQTFATKAIVGRPD